MKPSLALPLLAAALAATVGAVARAQAAPVRVTVIPAWTSEYIFRGLRLSGSSFQPSVEADSGPLALGVWSSVPSGGASPSAPSDPEIDLYGSYTVPIKNSLSPQNENNLSPQNEAGGQNNLSLQPGFTAYTFPHGPGKEHVTFEPNLALNWTVAPVRLTPKVYYDVVLRSLTGELNASWALPLPSIGTELDFGANGGAYETRRANAWVAGESARRARGAYWLAQVALPYQLGVHTRATASLGWAGGAFAESYAVGSPSVRNPREAHHLVASLSLATSF